MERYEILAPHEATRMQVRLAQRLVIVQEVLQVSKHQRAKCNRCHKELEVRVKVALVALGVQGQINLLVDRLQMEEDKNK